MPSLPWPFKAAPAEDDNLITRIKGKADSLPPYLIVLSAFALGGTATAAAALVHKRYFRRFATGDWIPPNVLERKQWIRGVVTTVGDADNFRLYHTPGLGWRWPLKFRTVPNATKDLKDQTIHIRIGGVDAPEAAHFGRPAQPYAPESLAWLKNQILGKTLYCQLLRRDQYSRIVATVQMSPRILPGTFFSGKNLSMEMLRAGWVTTYEQSGAEYGKYSKEDFLLVEADAKAAKRGMWKHGTKAESPADYKRRYAAAAAPGEPAPAPKTPRRSSGGGVSAWFTKFTGRSK